MEAMFGITRQVYRTCLFVFATLAVAIMSNIAAPPPSASAAVCGSEPSSTTGRSTQQITVPATDTYTIWSRIKAPDANPAEYTVYVDGQCFTIGQTAQTPDTLTWVDYENGSSIDKATISLSAGSHTLVLTAGTEDLELDRVMLLSDSCVPTGTGDNCLNDTTLPNTSITSPANGATVGGAATITATATDNDAIDYVELYRDGSTLLGSDNSSPYSYGWDTTSVSDGAYSLTTRAYDISGNVRTSTSVNVTVNNAPPVNAEITSFSAVPTTITAGQSTTLSWVVAEGANCSINQGVGSVGLSGDQSVSPTSTTTYTLSCDGENGGSGDSAQVSITVNPAPVNANITNFTATPQTIYDGQSSTLGWTVSAGTNCSIDQSIGSVGLSGTQSVSPSSTTIYTLSCDGQHGGSGDSQAVTLTVTPAPVAADISSFTASPATIVVGESSTLSWSVAVGQDCSIDQGVGAVSTSGSQAVSPVATTTYILSCNGINGGAFDTSNTSVTVNPAPVNASITSFSASPASITEEPGETSQLSWSVSAGNGCSMNQGIGAVGLTGTRDVSPSSTTTYTLSCNGQYGGAADSEQITVTVTPAPDTDGDNVKDYIERAAPNSGDANDDGTLDSQQANVTSFINSRTGGYNTLVTEGDCDVLGNVSSTNGKATYQMGVTSFTLECASAGQSAQIELVLDQEYDTSLWDVMKVNNSLTTETDISRDVTISSVNMGGESRTRLAYTLVDGGELDEDGVANGTIVDPLAITSSTPLIGAPSAGTGSRVNASMVVVGVGLGITTLGTAGMWYFRNISRAVSAHRRK